MKGSEAKMMEYMDGASKSKSRENRPEGAAGCGSGNCKRSGGTEISGTPK